MNSALKTPDRRLLYAIAVTTAFEGIRAGVGVLRALLDLPARLHIGPAAFAEFSRATDLSKTGIAFYVIYGFGGAFLTGTVWILAVRTRALIVVRRLSAVAAVCSILILALTTQAAPLMFRIGSAPSDSVVLQNLLDRFTFWTDLRIACACISFLAMLGALTALASRPRAP